MRPGESPNEGRFVHIQDTQSKDPTKRLPGKSALSPAARAGVARAFSPPRVNPHTARIAELRALAAGAPLGLQDIARDIHARADIMERAGVHEHEAIARLGWKTR